MCAILWDKEICHCCHLQFTLSVLLPFLPVSPLLTLRLDKHLQHSLPELLDVSLQMHKCICPSIFQMRQDHFD